MGEQSSTVYTKEYVLSEASRLREWLGQKSFWEDLEKASKAVQALLYAYVNIPEREFDESVERSVVFTCDEYDRRLAFILSQKLLI